MSSSAITLTETKKRTFRLPPGIADARKAAHWNNEPVEKGLGNYSDCHNSSFHRLQECRSFRVAEGFGWSVYAGRECQDAGDDLRELSNSL